MPEVYTQHVREGSDRRKPVGPLLLDKRTLCGKKPVSPRGQWSLCAVDLLKSGVMQYGYGRLTGGNHGIKGKGINREANEKKAIDRARRVVREIALNIQASRIVTLTYHENVKNRQVAIYHLQEFNREMRKVYPRWECVGVPETQKRGAIHWHLATPCIVDEAVVLSIWRKVTGDDTITQVDCGYTFKPNGKGNMYTMCAGYIVKYIGKDMNVRGFEEHRYHATRGLRPEVKRYYLPAHLSSIDIVCSVHKWAQDAMGEGLDVWTPDLGNVPYGFVRITKTQMQEDG